MFKDQIKEIILDKENWFSPPDLNGFTEAASEILKDKPEIWSSLTLPKLTGYEKQRALDIGRLIRAASSEPNTVHWIEDDTSVVVLARNDALERARTPNVMRISKN